MKKILVLVWVPAKADLRDKDLDADSSFGCRNPGEEWEGERGRES